MSHKKHKHAQQKCGTSRQHNMFFCGFNTSATYRSLGIIISNSVEDKALFETANQMCQVNTTKITDSNGDDQLKCVVWCFNEEGVHLVKIFCTRNNTHFANQGHRVSSMDHFSWGSLNQKQCCLHPNLGYAWISCKDSIRLCANVAHGTIRNYAYAKLLRERWLYWGFINGGSPKMEDL